jgi:hypothetical protein
MKIVTWQRATKEGAKPIAKRRRAFPGWKAWRAMPVPPMSGLRSISPAKTST